MKKRQFNPGRFFTISFAEDFPTDETLYFIQDYDIGGIILFANHCWDILSVRRWIAELKKSLKRPLIVAVDQEGGRVRRFYKNFPILESPRYYGYKNRMSEYQSDLARTCERLYETGVNVNLVPTVDLFDSEEGHVLDTRTFSDDIDVVAEYTQATIRIHHEQGLCCCAKHFPGLGRAHGDPHATLSATSLTERDFFDRELKPFEKAIEFGVDTVMVTHLSLPKIDTYPSLVSEKIITGWLKDRLGFGGPVITDDLLMDGAAQIDPTPSLAGNVFNAGADMLLFGQKLDKAKEALEAFIEAKERGVISIPRLQDAERRLSSFVAGLSD